jgi:hypothetical protein
MRATTMIVAGVAAMAMMLAAAGRSSADIITYTVTVTGSGTLDGTSFTDAPVTISATADSVNIFNFGGNDPGTGLYNVDATGGVNVSVGGVGSDALTGLIFVISDQSNNVLDINEASIGDISALFGAGVAAYDLSAPALIAGVDPGFGAGITHATTNGSFEFDSFSGTEIFTATSVPEPSSLALCGIAGAIGLAVARRRRGRGA